jgi:hypothetical protein
MGKSILAYWSEEEFAEYQKRQGEAQVVIASDLARMKARMPERAIVVAPEISEVGE